MLFRSLALCATFALTANSFLIPSSIADDFSKAPGSHIVDLNPQIVELDCNGCLYAEARDDGGYSWIPNVPYALVLNFSVPSDQPDTLKLNDVPLYPIDLGIHTPLSAPLHRSGKSSVDLRARGQEGVSPSLGLSYSLEIFAPVEIADDKDIHLVTLNLKILALDRQSIEVDRVVLQLLKSSDGHLVILRADKVADSDPPASPSDQEKAGEAKECTTFPLLCKWKAILEDKVNSMKTRPKGCHRHKSGPMQMADSDRPASRRPPHYINRHGPHGPQHGRHGHGHHHWQHTLSITLQNIFLYIVLPVMFGIATGMLASAIGMLVGQVLVLLWIRYRRGGKKGLYAKVQQEMPATEGSVEAGVADKDSPPPAYEDAEAQSKMGDEKQQQQPE